MFKNLLRKYCEFVFSREIRHLISQIDTLEEQGLQKVESLDKIQKKQKEDFALVLAHFENEKKKIKSVINSLQDEKVKSSVYLEGYRKGHEDCIARQSMYDSGSRCCCKKESGIYDAGLEWPY